MEKNSWRVIWCPRSTVGVSPPVGHNVERSHPKIAERFLGNIWEQEAHADKQLPHVDTDILEAWVGITRVSIPGK
jgi:hypothetical protein